MTLALGIETQGISGALALISTNTLGVLRYLAHGGFSPQVVQGAAVLPLVNNTAQPANKIIGESFGVFSLALPFDPVMLPADFFARAIGSAIGDVSNSNYHTLTAWDDNISGDAPRVYAGCKFASYSGQIDWAANGATSAIQLGLTGRSADPESATVLALAAPSAGSLSTATFKAAAQASLSGVSDYARVAWQITTGLVRSIGPSVAGNNAKYPWLPPGWIMAGIGGSVTVTQNARAATLLSQDGSDGTLVVNMGTVGSGVAQTMKVFGRGATRPSNLGPNMMETTYQLKSPDGQVAMVSWASL